LPKNARETAVAITDEIIIGLKLANAKFPIITSRAKNAPAIGALNVAAIPAAAPQPTSTFNRCGETFNHCPIAEANAEPICTIGPSRPTDPPVAMVIADANDFTKTTRGLITPFLTAIASITSGTP